MAKTTRSVRVTEAAHEILRRLAAQTGKSMRQVVEDAVEEYEPSGTSTR
jgi:predicted HicB family RNase H-like nuclease